MSAEEALRRAGQIEVSVRQLGNIKAFLAEVAKAVPDYREGFRVAERVLRTGGDEGRSALGQLEMVGAMHAQIDRLRVAVDTNLADLAAGLAKTGDAVATLARRYTSVEARNRVAVSELQKLLDE